MALPACEGCGQEEAEQKDTGAPQKVDTAPEQDKEAKKLEEATEKAEKAAEQHGINVYDKSMALAGKFEAAQKEDERPAPPPRRKPVKTTGQIPKKGLQKVFSKHSEEAQNCYERALKQDQSLSGRLILQLTIGTDGSVLSARANGRSLRSEQVNDCLERQAVNWTFPEPNGGAAKVNKPYSFSPKQ